MLDRRLAIGISAPLNGGRLALVVAGYVVFTVSYSIWLKHEPVLDLGAVAAGFVLRAIAGAAAVGVPISQLVPHRRRRGLAVHGHGQAPRRADGAGRRLGRSPGARSASTRPSFLGYVRAVASGVAIMAYCLWAFEKAAPGRRRAAGSELSIVPFVLAVLRYALLVEQGGGGAPEEVVLADRVLQALGVPLGRVLRASASMPDPGRTAPRRLLTGWGRTAPTARRRSSRAERRRRRRRRARRRAGRRGVDRPRVSGAATATPRRTPAARSSTRTALDRVLDVDLERGTLHGRGGRRASTR